MISERGKGKLAIVMAATRNVAFAVGSVLVDLRRTHSQLEKDIVIFHDGFSFRDRRAMAAILPVQFRRYRCPIQDFSRFHPDSLARFRSMVYAKYECLLLLDEYETVLFIDYDMVINGDLSALLGRADSDMTLFRSSHSKVAQQFFSAVDGYDMEPMAVTSAFMVFHDSLPNYRELYHWCLSTTEALGEKLYLPEQGVINLMLQAFPLGVRFLDEDEYCCNPRNQEPGNANVFLHVWGVPKFWDGFECPQWDENYRDWLKAGGSAIPRLKRKVPLRDLVREILRGAKRLWKKTKG